MNTADTLHAAIINLRCEAPYESGGPYWQAGYRIGHRDARHAAAELVSASLVAPQEPIAWMQRTRSGYVRGLQTETPTRVQREIAEIERDEFVPLYALPLSLGVQAELPKPETAHPVVGLPCKDLPPALHRWIPVSERNPDSVRDVVIWYEDTRYLCSGYYSGGSWFNNDSIRAPSHWRELPPFEEARVEPSEGPLSSARSDEKAPAVGVGSPVSAVSTAMEVALDGLAEIALAGMSLPMEAAGDEDAAARFHANQAWNFIGIAARTLDRAKALVSAQQEETEFDPHAVAEQIKRAAPEHLADHRAAMSAKENKNG